jgi:hypothetical protein
MPNAKSTLHENMPKDGDGCTNRSWRCDDPNRKDMENGRIGGTTSAVVKNECNRCPVCMMIFCKYHMKEMRHMEDCNFRSNQERVLLEEQRSEDAKIKAEEKKDAARLIMVKREFEEKEKIRRANIAERNRKAQGK